MKTTKCKTCAALIYPSEGKNCTKTKCPIKVEAKEEKFYITYEPKPAIKPRKEGRT